MIQAIKYELKKYVFSKNNFIIILLLTLAWLIIVFLMIEGGLFFEKTERQDFYSHAVRSFTVADEQKVTEERDELYRELYEEKEDGTQQANTEAMKKRGKYTSTKVNDYSFLNELITCMEVIKKRNENTALIVDKLDKDSHDYEKENNYMLADRTKLTAIVRSMSFGWLPCLALIIILSFSFSMEYENNMNLLLCVTKRGQWTITMAKIVTGILSAVILNIYFWMVYLASQIFFVGMTGSDWEQPLFLADGYQLCASGLTVKGFFVNQAASLFLVSVLVVMFTLLLSKIIRKGNYTLLAALGIFVIMLLPDLLDTLIYSNVYLSDMSNWYLLSEPAFYRILAAEKIFNPFSMIQFGYYMEQPRYIQIQGAEYPTYSIPVILAVILIGTAGIVLLYERVRRHTK